MYRASAACISNALYRFFANKRQRLDFSLDEWHYGNACHAKGGKWRCERPCFAG